MQILEATEQILKNRGLRVTPIRKKILALFEASSVALSQNDIELELNESDRITLYRTLKRFESSGILHKVINDSNQMKYAICSDSCAQGDHVDEHVHFECDKCGSTECLDQLAIPQIMVPEGYQKSSLKILMKGLCRKCS